MSQLEVRQAFRRILAGEIGVVEDPKGSNRGPRVDQYNIRAGYGPVPVYWCLSLQFFCIDEACKEVGVANPVPRTGDCDTVLFWARKNGYAFDKPQADDLFMYLSSHTDATHTGAVDRVLGDGSKIQTIEGNSNNDGSRNGYKVVQHERRLAKLEFVRWWLALADGYDLQIGARRIPLQLIGGTNYAPVRQVVKSLGLDDALLTWNNDDPGVMWNGREIPATPQLRDGSALLPVRALGRFFGNEVDLDEAAKLVTFRKPGQ